MDGRRQGKSVFERDRGVIGFELGGASQKLVIETSGDLNSRRPDSFQTRPVDLLAMSRQNILAFDQINRVNQHWLAGSKNLFYTFRPGLVPKETQHCTRIQNPGHRDDAASRRRSSSRRSVTNCSVEMSKSRSAPRAARPAVRRSSRLSCGRAASRTTTNSTGPIGRHLATAPAEPDPPRPQRVPTQPSSLVTSGRH